MAGLLQAGHYCSFRNYVGWVYLSDSGNIAGYDAVFESFVRRRENLNESLDESKRAIDRWLERQQLPAPISSLANLEVLLKTRRDLLEELVALDDGFMLHLLRMRGAASED